MKRGLTNSMMETEIISELQCTKAVNPSFVLGSICIKISLPGLLSTLSLSIGLRMIGGQQNGLNPK